MVEGCLVQDSCVWVSKYLGHVYLAMCQLRKNKDDDRLVDKVRQGKGLQFLSTRKVQKKIMSYCIASAVVVEKWHQKYTTAQIMDVGFYYKILEINRVGKSN